jgi:predicted ester cyclase
MSDLKDAVRRFFAEQVSNGTFDALDHLFAQDVVMHSPMGELDGHEGLVKLSASFKQALPDGTLVVEEILEDGDMLAWRLHGQGTNDGPFLHLPASGRRIEWRNNDMARVRDGKIVEIWGGPDMFAILTQMGVIPQPEGAPA